MPQDHLSRSNISVISLGAHLYHELKALHVFHDVLIMSCDELLPVLLTERDGKVQECVHGLHERGGTAHSSVRLVYKRAEPDARSFGDCGLVLANNETNRNVFLNVSYVFLHP